MKANAFARHLLALLRVRMATEGTLLAVAMVVCILMKANVAITDICILTGAVFFGLLLAEISNEIGRRDCVIVDPAAMGLYESPPTELPSSKHVPLHTRATLYRTLMAHLFAGKTVYRNAGNSDTNELAISDVSISNGSVKITLMHVKVRGDVMVFDAELLGKLTTFTYLQFRAHPNPTEWRIDCSSGTLKVDSQALPAGMPQGKVFEKLFSIATSEQSFHDAYHTLYPDDASAYLDLFRGFAQHFVASSPESTLWHVNAPKSLPGPIRRTR